MRFILQRDFAYPLALWDGQANAPHMSISVAALYRFTRFDDPLAIRKDVRTLFAARGIKGTIILAREGINGTIAGSEPAIGEAITLLKALPGCAAMDVKYATAENPPFYRLKIHVKPEIVTLGVPGIDPSQQAGHYVAAADWNALISDPETLLIDTRNAYEVRIGSFAGAVNPNTRSFRDFPAWFRAHRAQLMKGKRRVAMFCTGGIRCEKSTAFLKSEGVDDVHHLEGGILRYLEDVPAENSLWHGDCFVFDQRVAVTHGLAPGAHSLCHSCREPLSAADMASQLYVAGVSCPFCHDRRDADGKARLAERERQMQLAAARGDAHLGVRRPG